MMKRPTRRQWLAIGTTGAVLALAAVFVVREVTSSASGIEAAEHADSRACAGLADGYPDTVAGKDRDRVDVPGAASWGDGAVVWRCGLTPIPPTVDPCVTVNGVDWVLREAESTGGRKSLITYGRTPAVEVTIRDDTTAIDAALVDISRMATPLRKYTKCISTSDVPL
ncbi:DUF3515 domain-containing protein [Streptomyces cucumeris]|uniref:DUF3515 domain-containing protein n=1 Tax=Streptomyces cucumeris TaxID=2962890 RepID=UPI003D733041